MTFTHKKNKEICLKSLPISLTHQVPFENSAKDRTTDFNISFGVNAAEIITAMIHALDYNAMIMLGIEITTNFYFHIM